MSLQVFLSNLDYMVQNLKHLSNRCKNNVLFLMSNCLVAIL